MSRVGRWWATTVVLLVGLLSGACTGTDSGPAAAPSPPAGGDAVGSGQSPGPGNSGWPAGAADLGLSEVVLLTAEQDVGPRPEFRWEPVDGADRYDLVLVTEQGEGYWAWSGTDTSVHLGGEPRLRDEAPGPRLTGPMTWSVVAYTAGEPVGVSAFRPVSP